MSDGAFLGLIAGLGLLSIWWSMWEQEEAPSGRGVVARQMDRLRDDLIKVGLDTVPPAAVPALSVGLGLVVAAGLWAGSSAVVPSLAIGAVVSLLPTLVLRSAARRRTTAMREVWPEAVDHINSAIRAGLSLPEALVQLSRNGPEELRPAFAEYALDYQASGDFASCLDRLKIRLADPVGDRIVRRCASPRDVEGRPEPSCARWQDSCARTPELPELEARQSWTVNAARLALAAPWVVLALMSTRPQAAQAYDTGMVMILIGAVVAAARLPGDAGDRRLPQDERVLR